jgi:actin-related protein
MEKIWQHTFQNELKVNPSEHPVLLTDGPLSGTNERREMIQRMFEKFNTPSFNISRRPALALYSSGKTTGVVLSSGDGITHTVPIYEGYAMAHAVCRLEVAGEDLTRYFGTLLPPGHSFTSPAELEILRTMKEKLSYVTLDPAGELRRAQESSTIEREYELPDGQIISVGKGRFLTPDALFNPSAISGGEEKGVHELVFESIKKCDMDTRRTLYQNIFVTGGSTLFNGFTERLTKEVVRLVPPSIQDIIQVEAIPDRYAAWKGGCAYASLLASQKMWITKEEYQEHGFTIVTRKCS